MPALIAACILVPPPGAAEDIPVPRAVVGGHRAPAGPQILAMSISDRLLKPGEVVTGHVETTADVTTVEVHVGFWGMALEHARTGYFQGSGKIPHLPFFLKGKWTMHVIAKTANGQKTERDVLIRLL